MTVEQCIKARKGTIVDVRSYVAFSGGSVVDSVNIPLEEIHPKPSNQRVNTGLSESSVKKSWNKNVKNLKLFEPISGKIERSMPSWRKC